MSFLTEFPLLLLAVSFGVLVLATALGARVRGAQAAAGEREHTLDIVLAATFTLLALMTGFVFSMAVARYDLRKSCEATEANAIGTEYARAGLLPAADAARTRALLEEYLNERIHFYETQSPERLRQIGAQTVRLQGQLWSGVEAVGNSNRDAVSMLVASGMNDVLNAQSYTQAAWWNRIPAKAWDLLVVIAIMGAALLGYSGRLRRVSVVQVILPLLIALAFFLIADIDSPRAGLMNVEAENLHALAESYAEAARARTAPASP
jgi:hypothetical protein